MDQIRIGADYFLAFWEQLPDWAQAIATLLVALACALIVHGIFYRIAERFVARRGLFWRSLVSRTRGPMRLLLIAAALAPAAAAAPLTAFETLAVDRIMIVAIVVLFTWVCQIFMHIWATVYLRRFKLDSPDNQLARQHVTQTRILERVARVVIVIVGVSAALMVFPGVRQYGVSLLASAGAAGIIVGLALQPVLKNLFAGIQLAITQPIRLEDAVIVEGEWGRVEEITATYVVVRIWDLRRMILPLSYFIEKPFQNWTRDGAALIGSVMIYLDYAVPVDALRSRAQEIARSSPLWDGKVFALQVTDFRERVMEVRIIVGARNSGDAFDLRCLLREQVVGWLLENYPESLPRTRAELQGGSFDGGDGRIQPARGELENEHGQSAA